MDYKKSEIKFDRAVVYSLRPIPQKAPFYDATGGPFVDTKIDHLIEVYDSDGVAVKIPCSSIMTDRILPLVLTVEK